jgi:hypothetical protein
MAYTIHNQPDGPVLGSGQTRRQVIRALDALGQLEATLPPLPRFGRVLAIVRPVFDPRGSIYIKHV